MRKEVRKVSCSTYTRRLKSYLEYNFRPKLENDDDVACERECPGREERKYGARVWPISGAAWGRGGGEKRIIIKNNHTVLIRLYELA